MAFYNRAGRRLEYQCLRCAHRWAPQRLERPNLCPQCKSRYWQTARTNRQGLRATPPRRPPRPVTPRIRHVMLKVRGIECRQCGHQWIPRTTPVHRCPQCRSVRFDTPKKTA